jgi:endonuclease/exonuclease/phosphatase family metal-dependent hydrolase
LNFSAKKIKYKNKVIAYLCLFLICFSTNYKANNHLKKTAFKDVHLTSKAANLKILTWNIKDLGGTKNTEEILFIAKIIKDFDIVAIQEVVAKDPRGAQAIAKIVGELNRLGSAWDYSISMPTKSPSSYISERYAYIWKTSKLRLKNKPFLDATLENVIEREPYIAKFEIKKNKTLFYFINIHARVHNKNPEMEIAHFKKYPERLQTDNIIILGDFNLNEKHNVWNPLSKKGFKPAIKNTATTLKRACKNGIYTNHAIDNIYYNSRIVHVENSGIVDFVSTCSNLVNARMISDHLPVFLEMSLVDKNI